MDSEVLIEKFAAIGKKTYLSGASSMAEAEQMAPAGANVQQGPQGGFFYDGSSSGGDSEESDSGESEGVSGMMEMSELESEYGGWEVDTDKLDLEDAEVGDFAYIEHPSGDYIIEVSDVKEGALVWEDNAGTKREIRDDTTSQFVAVVENPPEIGADETIEPVNGYDDVEDGDVVYWTDPGGSEFFSRVLSHGSNSVSLETGDSYKYSDLKGKVVSNEPPDPTEQYDVEPDTHGYDFAKAVIEGYMGNDRFADNSVPVRKIQHHASDIDDINLIRDMIKMERAGRNSKSALKAGLEPRYRALGGDPEDLVEATPGEVPSIREGTDFANFSSSDAVRASGAVIHHWKKSANTQDWNEFMDHMTQKELAKSLEVFADHNIRVEDTPNYQPNLMDYEAGDVVDDFEELAGSSKNVPPPITFASHVTRMDDETLKGVVEELDGKGKENVLQAAAMFAKDPETRLWAFNEAGKSDLHVSGTWQFEEDFDSFSKSFSSDWTGKNQGFNIAKVTLANYGPNEEGDTFVYVSKARPVAGIDPTPQLKENLDELRKQTQEYWETTSQSLPTVYRGVSKEVTTHGTADSWSESKSVAESFDGHAVLECSDLEPEDLLMDHKSAHTKGYGMVGYDSEEEYVILGGAFS